MKLFFKKNARLFMMIGIFISLIIGIVALYFSSTSQDGNPVVRVFVMIIGVMGLVMAVLIMLYLFETRETDPNFFLFDRKKKKNIIEEELTFKIVNDRMTFFLTLVSTGTEQLWRENILDLDNKMGYKQVYRPLVAYKMLYDVIDYNDEINWNYLFSAPEEILSALYSSLEQAEENEFTSAFRFIMKNYINDKGKIKSFLCVNEKYLRSQMLKYVKKNIEMFY